MKKIFTFAVAAMMATNIMAQVQEVAGSIKVSIGGMFNYENESVTYQVTKYQEGDVEKLDVVVPTYTLEKTLMGDLTLGTYTVKGLIYDESKGGFYRDYKDDGLVFHFTSVKNGTVDKDTDYEFNSKKDNNILVKYEGNNVSSIVNTFQMGAMPFGIKSTFNASGNNGGTTGIDKVENAKNNDGKMYNLRGQRVDDSYKGIVIMNGKKFLKK